MLRPDIDGACVRARGGAVPTPLAPSTGCIDPLPPALTGLAHQRPGPAQSEAPRGGPPTARLAERARARARWAGRPARRPLGPAPGHGPPGAAGLGPSRLPVGQGGPPGSGASRAGLRRQGARALGEATEEEQAVAGDADRQGRPGTARMGDRQAMGQRPGPEPARAGPGPLGSQRERARAGQGGPPCSRNPALA